MYTHSSNSRRRIFPYLLLNLKKVPMNENSPSFDNLIKLDNLDSKGVSKKY